MRKILLAAAVIGAALVPAAQAQAATPKPVKSAFYCAPWVDYWCYQRYLRCGPTFYVGGGIYIDRCYPNGGARWV